MLEPFVGQLRLGDALSLLENDDGEEADALLDDPAQRARDAEKAAKQLRRQVQLAVGLADRLEPFVRGDLASFSSSARAEARGILERDASLDRFLAEIGWVYRNRADLHLARLRSRLGALGYQAICVRMRRGGREARQKATTAKLAVRSFLELRKIVQEADSKEGEEKQDAPASAAPSPGAAAPGDGSGAAAEAAEEDVSDSLTQALPTFMETFWSLTAHDITGTLDKVIERVLGDESVSIADRRHRAEALQKLGTAFMEEAEASRKAASQAAGAGGGGDEDERKRRRFEEAFAASVGAGHR